MKTQRMMMVMLTLGMLCHIFGARQVTAQETAEQLYQAALYQEEVQGNLERAIQLYERIVAEHPRQRAVAAKALMQMGLCQEKLGRTEAEEAYLRLVREYADQGEVVARARARLALLRQTAREASGEATAISTRRIQKWSHGEGSFPMAITPDGRRLIYHGDANLVVRELATGQDRALIPDTLWNVWGVGVSPDGRTLSYQVGGPASGSLHLADLDGGLSRALYAPSERVVGSHAWTSDGQEILAFVHGPRGVELARISVAGAIPKLVETRVATGAQAAE